MSGAMIPMRDAFAEKEKKTKLKLTPSTAEVPTIMGLSSTFALCSTMHQVSERYWVSFQISHRMSNITSITTITRVGLTSLIGFGILTVIQAFIFLHEMFHVDAISAPNQHIGDLWLNPGDGGDWEPAYGADFAKLVARAQNPGGWVIRNAENLAIFAMVMEYQSALGGNYPALPFSQDPLDDDPRARNPNPNSIFNFTDGTLGIANLSAYNQLSPKFDNPESVACLAEPAITFDVSAEMFMKDLDYPEEYRSAMSSWKSSYVAHWTTASSSASDVPSAPTAVASTTGTPSAPTDASFPASATPTSTPTKLPIISSKARCTCSYKVLYDEFEILGLNFAYQDLKRQLDGCGLVTDWNVQNVVGDPDDMQFKATGKLPIGTKACVGRAVVSAGGNTADQCTGAG